MLSPFQAFMTALAASIGTGNIAGVATAVVSGGPGALFWIWCYGFFATAIKFAEAVLGVRYRSLGSGGLSAGPMRYLSDGLGLRRLGWLYALVAGIAALTTTPFAQPNSIAVVLDSQFKVPTLATGILVAVLTWLVIIGGVTSIGRAAEKLSPVKVTLYLVGGLLVLVFHADRLPETIALVFREAFSPPRGDGQRRRDRDDDGHALRARARHVRERGRIRHRRLRLRDGPERPAGAAGLRRGHGGLRHLLRDLDDQRAHDPGDGRLALGLTSTAAVAEAFNHAVPVAGGWVVAFCAFLFGYTTLIGWAYYGEQSLGYIFGPRVITPYRWVYCGLVVLGAVSKVDLVWAWGDLMNGLQVFPNLVGVVGLSGVVAALLRRTSQRAARRAPGKGSDRLRERGELPPRWLRLPGRAAVRRVSLEEAARELGRRSTSTAGPGSRQAFRAYQAAFAPVAHRICYAVKANGNGAILRLMAGLGAGADIVSGGELLAAVRAGFPPERIVFAGVGKTDAEIALGLEHGIGEWNAESEDEIGRIAAAAASRGTVARVSLRVNPDIDPRSHPYVSTGLREAKFGIDIGLAPGILRRARERAGVEIVGLQCHIGSQITELEPLAAAARALAGLSRQLLDEGFSLRTIDVGGGLGVSYDGKGAPDVAGLASAILPAVERLPLTLVLEPGRSLVAGSGVLLTRVLYVKGGHEKTFVVVDAGMNDLLRPALYGAFHRVEPVRSRGRAAELVDVVGPVCETSDFLARRRELERPEPGDLLAVRDTGAYGFAMSSNYNMRPRAAEALVEDGRVRLVRRRETFDDLVRTEV